MGARRFGPDTGRFLQPDVYQGAMANLGLSVDPLTSNRYGLAAGNPVSYIEVDGHRPMEDGTGTGKRAPITGNKGLGVAPGYENYGEQSGYLDVPKDMVGVVTGAVKATLDGVVTAGSAAKSCAMDFTGCGQNVRGFAGAVWDDPGGVAMTMLKSTFNDFMAQVLAGDPGEALGGLFGCSAPERESLCWTACPALQRQAS